MNVEDYTQPVEKVIYEERKGRSPLTAAEVKLLFSEWKKVNQDAMSWLLSEAWHLHVRCGHVSAKYLIEKLRYESGIKVKPVVYFDARGKRREYTVSNDFTPLIARELQGVFPDMKIEKRKSRFDGENV